MDEKNSDAGLIGARKNQYPENLSHEENIEGDAAHWQQARH
jgi:hypothetical protein